MPEYRSDRTPTEFPFPAQLLTEPDDDKGGLSPFAIVNFLLRNLKLLLLIPLLAFAAAVLFTLSGDQAYVAQSKFLPARADPASSSAGLATELKGLVSGGRTINELVFYGAVVESSALLRKAAATEYDFEGKNDEGKTVRMRGTLARIHGLNPTSQKQDLNASLSIVTGMVGSGIESGTGFVVVNTQSRWPELAVAVNNRVLELVNEFNIEQRQTQAKAERLFVEKRLAEAKQALEDAEANLMAFIGSNQQFQQLSRAAIRSRQLEREVTLRQGTYTMLTQAYEQARITEVRNTPVVTVVERPEDTVHLERGGSAIRNGIFAFLVVGLIMLGVVLLRSYIGGQMEKHPDDVDEFMRQLRGVLPARVRKRLPQHAVVEASPSAVPAGGVPEGEDRAW